MNRLKNFVPINILLTLQNSVIRSYLNYGLLSFEGSSIANYFTKLCRLQKKVIRTVNNAGFLNHTSPLFAKFNILKLNGIHHRRRGRLMFEYMNNMLPQNFNKIFSVTFFIHSYKTHGSFKGDPFLWKNGPSFFKSRPFQRSVLY